MFVILQVGYYNQSCRSCGLYFCYLYFICIHVYFMDFFYSSDGLLTSKTNSYLVKYLHWQRQKTSLQYIDAITLLRMTANELSNNQQQTLARTSSETQQTRWWYPVPIQETESRAGKIAITRKDPTAGRQSGKSIVRYVGYEDDNETDQRGLKKSTERQKNITGRTIETSTNGYKDHRKYETVIVSSGSVWTS